MLHEGVLLLYRVQGLPWERLGLLDHLWVRLDRLDHLCLDLPSLERGHPSVHRRKVRLYRVRS